MKIMSTIIVLILATLGVVAMWRAGFAGEDNRIALQQSSRLLTRAQLPIDELQRITVARQGEPTLVFQKVSSPSAPEQWQQVQPFAHPMETYAMRQLALQALELETTDRISPADLARQNLTAASLALDPPAAEIKYETSGQSLTLRLGRRSVAGRAYAQITGDDSIYFVDQRLHDRVEMDDEEWRHRTIFDDAGIESSRIEWQNGNFRMALQRERKQWMMVEPVRTRLDAGQRDMYMQAIGTATVSSFVLDQPSDADLARFGLQDPPVSLTITGAALGAPDQIRTQRLFIGSRAGGGTMDHFGIVEGRPVIVRVSGPVIAALFRQPQDLAAHTGSGINPADVKSIVIRSKDQELRFERDLEKWRGVLQSSSATAPDAPPESNASASAREVNPALVNQLLEQLTSLRAPSVEIAEYPRQLEVGTITLHGYDGKAIDTVRIIHEPSSGKWALENGDNVLRVFTAEFRLRLTAADYGLQ